MKANTPLLVIAAWLLAAGVTARASGAEPSRVVTDYTATLWADADGHPVGAVSAIVQDRDGYLWVGSTAGLFRFDGVRFTPWNQLSEARLPATWVSSLLATADGGLWVGFGDQSTLAHITGRAAEVHTLPGAGPVAAILQDQDGTLWTVAAFSLFQRAGGEWMRVPVRRDSAEVRVHDVGVSRNGGLLISTERGLFAGRRGAREFRLLVDGYIWSAGEERNGSLWVTDTLAGFKVGVGGHAPRPVGDALGGGYRLMFDRDGQAWIGTIAEGLWRVRLNGGQRASVEKATLRSASFNDAVQSLFEDRDGNIWVGTTAGLHRLNRQLLQSVPIDGVVINVDLTSRSDLWASTPSGLVRLALADGTWTATKPRAIDEAIRLTTHDSSGSVWTTFGTGGLGRLVGNHLVHVAVPPEFAIRSRILFLIADPQGGIWFGDGQRVLRWDGREFSAFAPRSLGDNTPPIRLVTPDRAGRLWIAFADGRLGVRERDGIVRMQPGNPASSRSTIYAIAEGADERIWLGTDHGIARVVGGMLRTANPESGLPTGRISTIVEDGDGYLWADTSAGLLRIRSEEFDKAASTAGYHAQFEFFDASDGAAGAPTITSRSGRAWDGKVWFVRSGALTIADPQVLRQRTKPRLAPVIIDNIKANERTYAPAASLALASDTRRVQIEFTTVALSKSTRVRYRYRLDGLDTDWVDAEARHAAVYTNLPPRKYRFIVQAGSDEDGWSAATTSYEFDIHPAFYQTTAFGAAAVLAIGLLVFAVWRIRVGVVRRQYGAVLEERMRLSREIHDTLLQGVVGVALQLGNVSNDRGMPRASRATLREMRDQVEAYIREARQSIFDLRSPLLEEHDLVGALHEVGRRAVANTSVGFSVMISGQAKRYPPRLENELLRIAQEAITNAVRHARASQIVLAIGFEASQVSIEVSDDGRGLARTADVEDTSHIGLASMKERAESMGGRVTIRRSAEGGTAIEATLPILTAA
jgi:signal transduction histidine kinase/ligand-binding sensor domain-containing protein